MDHAGISQDQEDLARYRAGLAPIKRKEYKAYPITIEQITKDALKVLNKQLKRKVNNALSSM